jgi:hypothetical protein
LDLTFILLSSVLFSVSFSSLFESERRVYNKMWDRVEQKIESESRKGHKEWESLRSWDDNNLTLPKSLTLSFLSSKKWTLLSRRDSSFDLEVSPSTQTLRSSSRGRRESPVSLAFILFPDSRDPRHHLIPSVRKKNFEKKFLFYSCFRCWKRSGNLCLFFDGQSVSQRN